MGGCQGFKPVAVFLLSCLAYAGSAPDALDGFRISGELRVLALDGRVSLCNDPHQGAPFTLAGLGPRAA